MNALHHIAPFRLALLLIVLTSQVSPAQVPLDGVDDPTEQTRTDGVFLPEGIEATGDTAEVRALTAWAAEHQWTRLEQAEQAARRALALARDLDDQRGVGESLRVLGNIVPDLGQKEAYYTTAREAYEQIGDDRGLYRIQANMGNVYKERGELEQALTAYFEALEEFERLDDVELQVGVLNNIANTHKDQGNLGEALVYYERATGLAETLDKPVLLTYILDNFGVTLAEHGSYERAESVLRRALAISEEQGDRYSTATVSSNLGYVFNKRGHYEGALPFLFAAERLSEELAGRFTGVDELSIAVYHELGKAYFGLEEYDRALHYANKSLTSARNVGSLSNQMEVHQTLSRIYEAAGDNGQALAHHRQYATVRDSVVNAEKAEIITEMQTRYETEEKQRANERLEQKNRIQALQLTLLLGAAVIALLIAGLFYYRYRTKQKANRLLEELDAAKSRFFANISHEFRTPLTVILGGLKDNIARRYNKDTKRYTEEQHAMLRNTRQLQRLVDEVLDLNRLESGKLDLQRTPGDLVRTLRRLIETDAPLAERNGIDLTFDHNIERCPRLYDQEKLEKIVGNLLSNALKFTPEGGSVRVSLECGKETTITVTDDGPGIPAEMQEKVFERFAQVEDGALHSGTGIGLALAKELAELHGGTITLESEPGKGSSFTVRLPLEEAVLPDTPTRRLSGVVPEPRRGIEAEAEPPRVAESSSPEEFDLGGNGHVESAEAESEIESGLSGRSEAKTDRTTVLIIEDNADVRAFIRRSLEGTYRVLEAADGEAGLQQARTELPDLIVSDVMLPGIDGYEIARRLKVEADTECIPVVMLTARAAEEDQTEGYGSGAEVYITKPFAPETLRAAVARLLEERRRLQRRLREEAEAAEEKGPKNGYSTLRDRARTAVLEHLHDEDFGVEELASTLGMSRSTLHHRLKQEIDIVPSDFVRTLRLERARELLADGAGSVSEVAYAVGFSSLVAFSRAYRTHYGAPPSSHRGRANIGSDVR